MLPLFRFLPYERLIICSSHMHFQTFSTRWKKAHVNTVTACQYLSWLCTESLNKFFVSERVDVTQLAFVQQPCELFKIFKYSVLCQLSILEHERNSGCFLRSVSGFTFPLLTKVLVVSQPVNACRATRARLISSPRSLATA